MIDQSAHNMSDLSRSSMPNIGSVNYTINTSDSSSYPIVRLHQATSSRHTYSKNLSSNQSNVGGPWLLSKLDEPLQLEYIFKEFD